MCIRTAAHYTRNKKDRLFRLRLQTTFFRQGYFFWDFAHQNLPAQIAAIIFIAVDRRPILLRLPTHLAVLIHRLPPASHTQDSSTAPLDLFLGNAISSLH